MISYALVWLPPENTSVVSKLPCGGWLFRISLPGRTDTPFPRCSRRKSALIYSTSWAACCQMAANPEAALEELERRGVGPREGEGASAIAGRSQTPASAHRETGARGKKTEAKRKERAKGRLASSRISDLHRIPAAAGARKKHHFQNAMSRTSPARGGSQAGRVRVRNCQSD